jgi:hypothetical protein
VNFTFSLHTGRDSNARGIRKGSGSNACIIQWCTPEAFYQGTTMQ